MSLNTFGAGLLSGLQDVDKILYRKGVIDRQNRQLAMAEELQPYRVEEYELSNEAKQLDIDKKRLENQTTQIAFDDTNLNRVAGQTWSRIQQSGQFVTRNTADDGAPIQLDLDGILGSNKTDVIRLMNASQANSYNFGVDYLGQSIKSDIADFRKEGDFYIVDIKPDGKPVGPMTQDRSADGSDFVRQIPAKDFEQGLSNLLTETWINTGNKTPTRRYMDMTALEDQNIAQNEAIRTSLEQQYSDKAARQQLLTNVQGISASGTPREVTDLIGDIQNATGEELDAIAEALGIDVTAARASAKQEMLSMYRPDGTMKSREGFIGPVTSQVTGKTMTELSAGFDTYDAEGNVTGEMLIPLMVPTLTREEIDWLANNDIEGKANTIPESIKQKAMQHAEMRIQQGKPVFYQDGERQFDQLDALKQQDPETGQVTYSDPELARELKRQLKALGVNPEIEQLVNTAGQKQQGKNSEQLVEEVDGFNLAEKANDFGEWVAENPVEFALLVGSGLLMLNPALAAAKGGYTVIKAAPAVARWFAKHLTTRKVKKDTRRDIQEQLRREAAQRDAAKMKDYDIPPSVRAQRPGGEPPPGPSVTFRNDTTSGLTRTEKIFGPGREISKPKIGMLGVGTAAYRLTDDGETTELERATGFKPTFDFNTDDAVREAIQNEVNDPDSEGVKRLLQSRGVTPANFEQKVRQLPTSEQLRVIYSVAKNSGGPIKEQMELVDKLTNQLLRGNMGTSELDQQKADTDQLKAQSSFIKNLKEYERQLSDQRNDGKPDESRLRESVTIANDVTKALTEPGGAFTLDNQADAVIGINKLAGFAAISTNPTERRNYQSRLMESMLKHIQAIGATGEPGFFRLTDKWDNFFNPDAQLRVGDQAVIPLLRAEFQTDVTTGERIPTRLYFVQGGTKEPLDFPITLGELYGMYEGRAADEIVKVAIRNTLQEQRRQSEGN